MQKCNWIPSAYSNTPLLPAKDVGCIQYSEKQFPFFVYTLSAFMRNYYFPWQHQRWQYGELNNFNTSPLTTQHLDDWTSHTLWKLTGLHKSAWRILYTGLLCCIGTLQLEPPNSELHFTRIWSLQSICQLIKASDHLPSGLQLPSTWIPSPYYLHIAENSKEDGTSAVGMHVPLGPLPTLLVHAKNSGWGQRVSSSLAWRWHRRVRQETSLPISSSSYLLGRTAGRNFWRHTQGSMRSPDPVCERKRKELDPPFCQFLHLFIPSNTEESGSYSKLACSFSGQHTACYHHTHHHTFLTLSSKMELGWPFLPGLVSPGKQLVLAAVGFPWGGK